MGKILSVAFSFEYGNCTYQIETEEGIEKHTLNPDHNFSESSLDPEIETLCKILWTDKRKSAWSDRLKYKNMTPEERKEAGYS